ncbi:MAG: hypothetical protein ACREEI_12185 [Stellaceae bacterium]
MKRFLFGTTFALAGLVGFVPLAKAAGPACMPVGAALFNTQAAAADAGGVAVRLGGDQAEDFVDYINDNAGHYADCWGDGIIVGRFPALGYDTLATIDDGCVNATKVIMLNPMTTNLAFQAAQFDYD